MNWMMRDSKGDKDAMLTFAFWSFIVVSFCIVLSMFKTVALKKFEIELASPDSALLLGYLAATFGAYVTRKYHKGKLEIPPTEKKE
jgi:hypothetical protein